MVGLRKLNLPWNEMGNTNTSLKEGDVSAEATLRSPVVDAPEEAEAVLHFAEEVRTTDGAREESKQDAVVRDDIKDEIQVEKPADLHPEAEESALGSEGETGSMDGGACADILERNDLVHSDNPPEVAEESNRQEHEDGCQGRITTPAFLNVGDTVRENEPGEATLSNFAPLIFLYCIAAHWERRLCRHAQARHLWVIAPSCSERRNGKVNLRGNGWSKSQFETGKAVVNLRAKKSPSFDFDLRITRTEESDRTPLLFQDKRVVRTATAMTEQKKFPIAKERVVSFGQADSRTPSLSFSWEEQESEAFHDSGLPDKQEKALLLSPAKNLEVVDCPSSPEQKGKRRPRSSLFGNCKC
ncbi:hypothetical protein MLD38_027295 [Melastoma candidum]|uniref:Uncharacterized protein n=1 Tax=Melastoma candidum TaxID=119954 RepID=A0ACB9P130_9MYRT|nr:hypothetical protein MLD38_027295 [Melastoma candidum]